MSFYSNIIYKQFRFSVTVFLLDKIFSLISKRINQMKILKTLENRNKLERHYLLRFGYRDLTHVSNEDIVRALIFHKKVFQAYK